MWLVVRGVRVELTNSVEFPNYSVSPCRGHPRISATYFWLGSRQTYTLGSGTLVLFYTYIITYPFGFVKCFFKKLGDFYHLISIASKPTTKAS